MVVRGVAQLVSWSWRSTPRPLKISRQWQRCQRREIFRRPASRRTSGTASCHGADARGEGPAAFVLKTPPPDLTTLAKRHSGKFPYAYVVDVLRFGTRIFAHGSSDMPIWGPIFGSMENYDEAAVRKRIKDLSESD